MTAPSRATIAGQVYLDLRRKARQDRRPVDELIQLYVLEGFLARLAQTAFAERFVLKGGTVSADPAENAPYAVSLSGQARRNIREHLPLDVAAAAMETVEGSIAVNPYRAGKPLDEPFDGYYSARRGTYRIVYRIDEAKHLVEIHSIRHRRDAHRA